VDFLRSARAGERTSLEAPEFLLQVTEVQSAEEE
jgi:hypothetical protein